MSYQFPPQTKKQLKLLLLFLLLTSVQPVLGQEEDIRKRTFNIRKNVAIEGYDPVSYFDLKPVPGDAKYQFNYKGVTYQFSSQENLTKFRSSPEKYEPAYGGWCAYAMADTGEKVKIDPETYKIVDGRLCLFYNFWGNNTLVTWNKDEKALKSKAELHWRMIQH